MGILLVYDVTDERSFNSKLVVGERGFVRPNWC